MAAPFAATYIQPAAPLPDWLSATSSPTLTTDLPYTVATFAPDGAATYVTSAVRATQYETELLQLPITVDSRADVSGQDLGGVYTTAGGTDATVVRAYGGTREFTLGASATRALAAAGTATAGGGAASTSAEVASPSAALASQVATARPATATTIAAVPPSTTSRLSASAPSSPASLAGASTAASVDSTSALAASSTASSTAAVAAVAASSTFSSLQAQRSSISAALDSAGRASSVNPKSVASLQAALLSASSALSVASVSSFRANRPSSLSSLPSSTSSSAFSSSTSTPSTTPPTSPTSSTFDSSTPSSSSSSSPSSFSPTSLHALTPSQLAAAIAAPICFFFLVLALLFLCCCCARRRRKREAEEEGDESFGGGASGSGGGSGNDLAGMAEQEGLLGPLAASGAGGGGARGLSRMGSLHSTLGGGRHRRKITWEWVAPRMASPPLPSGVSRAGSSRVGSGENGGGSAVGRAPSRGSGRSVLAALTGGLLGGVAARRGSSSVSGVGGEAEKPMREKDDEERRLLGTPVKQSRTAVGAAGAGESGFLTVSSPLAGRYSPVGHHGHQREGAAHGEDEENAGGQLQDVDLTSPRLDNGRGAFDPLPLDIDETHDAFGPVSAPLLPAFNTTNGHLSLSRFFTPSDDIAAPQAPLLQEPQQSLSPLLSSDISSHDSPLLRTPPLLAPPIPYISPADYANLPSTFLAHDPLDEDGSHRFGPLEAATHSLGLFRDDYSSIGGRTSLDFDPNPKRETRLGYRSWNTLASGVGGGRAMTTPPLTPESPPEGGGQLQTPSVEGGGAWRSGRPIVSEMGWLSGRLSGMMGAGGGGGGEGKGRDEEARIGTPVAAGEGGDSSVGSKESARTQGSSVLGESRVPSLDLFYNTARWLGGNRGSSSSVPPFSQLQPSPPNISYDPPITFGRAPDVSPSLPTFPSDSSFSRYDTTPQLAPSLHTPPLQSSSSGAIPESPLVHSPGFTFPRVFPPSTSTSSSYFRPSNPNPKRLSSSGGSVLNRIAQSFSSAKSNSADGHHHGNFGLGIAEEEGGEEDEFVVEEGEVPRFRGSYTRKVRQRELSTESATDPYQHRLPTRPLPLPSTPPRKPTRDVRRSQLRSSQTTPMLFLPSQDAPPLPPPSPAASTGGGRYSDPFEDRFGSDEGQDEEVVWAGMATEGKGKKEVPDIRRLQSVEG